MGRVIPIAPGVECGRAQLSPRVLAREAIDAPCGASEALPKLRLGPAGAALPDAEEPWADGEAPAALGPPEGEAPGADADWPAEGEPADPVNWEVER